MEPRISIITLGVTDLARSVEFYRDGLGLPLLDENTESIAFFQSRGTWLALYPRESLAADAGGRHGGQRLFRRHPAHNVRSREEVDAPLDVAVAAGATLVKAAGDTFWGGYSGYFADPESYLWEIAWNPHFRIEWLACVITKPPTRIFAVRYSPAHQTGQNQEPSSWGSF